MRIEKVGSPLGVLCVSCLLSATAVAEIRVESAMGVDSNIRRVEAETPLADGFVRMVAALDTRARLSKTCRLGARYHGGARHFLTHDEEDALVQRAEAQLVCKAGKTRLGLASYVRDRLTRDPAHPRDFAHASIQLPLRVHWGPLVASLSPSGGRFHFKPNPRYSATELGGTLGLNWRTPKWKFGVNGGWTSRDYGSMSVTGGGDAPRRRDDRMQLGTRLRYLGRWVGEASAGVVANESNDSSGGYLRHEVALSATTSLGLGVLLSTKLSVVRIQHDEALRLPDDLLLDDEGRTAWTIRLDKSLGDRWSLILHGGYWTSPLGTGPDYERVQGILGLSHR